MTKSITTVAPITRWESLYSLFVDSLYWMRKAHSAATDIAQYRFGEYAWILVIHPQLIEEVLVTQQKSFQKDEFLKHHARDVFGNGLLSNDGDFWLRQRRIAQPAFHRQRIADYVTLMVDKTAQRLAQLPARTTLDIQNWAMDLTLDIVAGSLFDDLSPHQHETIRTALDTIMAYFASENDIDRTWQRLTRSPAPTHVAYQHATQTLDQVIDDIIAARLQSGVERSDLLGMLLAARDDTGAGMSHQQLRDECKTMFLAGHETTALAISWSMWPLHRHPQALQSMRNEIQRVLGQRAPTFADIPLLHYTANVVRESMRLYPPAFIVSRTSTTDVRLGDYLITAGTTVNMSPFAMHRDARWYSNPTAFLPERWEEPSAQTLPKFAYFPFGGGPRLCIGQQFAQIESTIILCMLLQHGSWRLTPWQYINTQPSITIRPRFGIHLRVRAHAQ